MNRTEIINKLIKKNNYKTYLEIGLDNPDHNFNNVECESKESVDPFIEEEHNKWDHKLTPQMWEKVNKVLTYRMTSDEFFAQNSKKYDIILIDGLHTKEQVSKDIINSLKVLNPGGKIVVHDCLPSSEIAQEVPRKTAGWNGDVWKAIPQIKKQGVNLKVVNCDEGCGIIDYIRIKKNLFVPTEFEHDYKYFTQNKHELMNVISWEEFMKIYC